MRARSLAVVPNRSAQVTVRFRQEHRGARHFVVTDDWKRLPPSLEKIGYKAFRCHNNLAMHQRE